MRHFGEPLVETVFDFGKNGRPPAMPKLLDWLAVELMEPSGQSAAGAPTGGFHVPGSTGEGAACTPWSMKHLHRLIVTSSAYRMQSSATDHTANVSSDPDNQYVWRMNPRRLEAEAVRDSLLFVSGQLDLTMGGPDLDQNAGLTVPRRSIYFRNAYEKQMVFLRVFDGPNPAECYRRLPTVMPQQALAMANSPLAHPPLASSPPRCQKKLAWVEGGMARFIAVSFEQILNRQATAVEQSACSSFLKDQSARLKSAKSLSAFTSGDSGAVKPSSDADQRGARRFGAGVAESQ